MPKEFDDCRAAGGRIRTISGPSREHGLSANEYIHICFPKGGGPGVAGEKKQKITVPASPKKSKE